MINYINADELINDLLKSTPIDWHNYIVDAQEVRHGRWIDKGDFWVNCSICDCAVLKNEHDPLLRYTENYLYCPHCGARMDEVKE